VSGYPSCATVTVAQTTTVDNAVPPMSCMMLENVLCPSLSVPNPLQPPG
jgi:hypothetical protein